ncbi:serine phosphatase RsbU (regulator of sigma subunit)/anti-sigma regulatory factor (Ser/Thr protein kinase) [Streptomyces achromogenes]|uniref:SpoIIE family protein phosphatase n=1 Tax=Streptomyces achromogenes TaxID=67255 RepID=UPI002780899F|nr:serine phosphatase RsbU (regulator of sigma subunit)/anti-sigma regulatory factor (Ser/Thr protein kinase) [Streptomyces achromogenes]
MTNHFGAERGTGDQTAGVHDPAARRRGRERPAPSPGSGERVQSAPVRPDEGPCHRGGGRAMRVSGAEAAVGRAKGAGRDAAGQQTDRLRYLDAATREIARGMNLDETLRELCRAAVPAFADLAFVHLYAPLPVGDEITASPGVLRLRATDRAPVVRAAAHGPRPAPRPAGKVTAAQVVRAAADGLLARLLRAGRPVFGDLPGVRSVVAELLGATDTPGAVPPGRRLILAPLHGRSHAMGSVVLVRGPGRADFTGDDLLVASQLATHTALGIHKAVLYAREASVADTLQRTMLPPSLPEPTGVALASRYLPSSRTAQVGGDWYDAIPLPGNRVALVIGDVMGHSMTSAAIMGQLRTIVQTLAGLDLPPDEILHHLDEQAERLGSEHTATCLYAMYDPVLHRLLVSNAGHLPPVLLHPDGSTEILPVPPGAPIGVGAGGFESTEMHAPAGATLLLYTDGLVESRDSDVLTGVDRLRARLRSAGTGSTPAALEELCDLALGTLGSGGRDDDIALLAARFEGIPPETVAYWYMAPRPQTARQARRLTRRTLHAWGLDSLVESTELLVSEVVANAVRFASRPITLRLLRTDVLRCEVGDDSPLVPRMRHARLSDEGGRGLFLVDQLAQRWGATRVSVGKVVWFEQSLSGEQDPG